MSEYTADMIELLTAEPETEPHIVIAKDKTVIVPDELKEINTQFEHNIETVTFDCPRYWDEHDLSTMHIYINVRRPDKKEIPSLCSTPVVDAADATVIHFDWTLSKDVTHVKGTLDFVAVAKKADENGILQNRWGSRLNRDMEILEGIECETDEIVEESADIIEQILYRLETAAATASASAATAERAEKSAIAAAERANSVAASNPNLLDNWYFADPVNQRGKTEYVGAGYTIDRWALRSADESITIESDGIVINAGYGFTQLIENESKIIGKTVTFSALMADGRFDSATINQLETAWFGMSVIASRYIVGSGLMIIGNDKLLAVKLELGSVQTLAHQDANGNWVLNDPPPDKGMELMKCCMSTADPADDYANNKKTPAAVGAVNKAGDTMTGNLNINKASIPVVSLKAANGGETILAKNASITVEGGTYIDDVMPDGVKASLLIRAYNDLGETLQLSKGGVSYNILHTGNKPSGSYTGNGDATLRDITTGGIGNCCVIYGGTDEVAYVVPKGAFFQAEGVAKFTSDIYFGDGVLHVRNAYIVNTNGATYNYQVL